MVDSGDTDEEELTSVGKWRNEGGDEERKGAGMQVRMLVPLHLLPEHSSLPHPAQGLGG